MSTPVFLGAVPLWLYVIERGFKVHSRVEAGNAVDLPRFRPCAKNCANEECRTTACVVMEREKQQGSRVFQAAKAVADK